MVPRSGIALLFAGGAASLDRRRNLRRFCDFLGGACHVRPMTMPIVTSADPTGFDAPPQDDGLWTLELDLEQELESALDAIEAGSFLELSPEDLEEPNTGTVLSPPLRPD